MLSELLRRLYYSVLAKDKEKTLQIYKELKNIGVMPKEAAELVTTIYIKEGEIING